MNGRTLDAILRKKRNIALLASLILFMSFGLLFVGAFAHADTLVLCDSTPSELKGESRAPGASGCIDVASWSWGVSTTITAGAGGGATGKTDFAEFSLQKFLDSSSISLFTFIAKGTSVKGDLQFRQYGTCVSPCSSPVPYFTVDMLNVRVAGQSMGSSGDGRPTEGVSLYYDKIKICYAVQDASGMLGTPACQTYTISTGVTG